MGAKEVLLISLLPVILVIVVLAWMYLQSRRASSARLTLSGLGISIDIRTITREKLDLESRRE